MAADEIDYRIVGDDMQAVVITLDEGESVRAEAGAMLYMTDAIEMETSAEGGLLSGLKRAFTSESFFVTNFNCNGPQGQVAMAAPYPGKIVPLDLAETGNMLCQKDAYLCSATGIELDVAFTKKMGAGFFGGEGFVLQSLQGDGMAFVHVGGSVMKMDLEEGQNIRMDVGALAAFEEGMDYDIEYVGGIKTALFGGEGMFFATMSGPGTVYVQSLPFPDLVDRISRSMPNKG